MGGLLHREGTEDSETQRPPGQAQLGGRKAVRSHLGPDPSGEGVAGWPPHFAASGEEEDRVEFPLRSPCTASELPGHLQGFANDQ